MHPDVEEILVSGEEISAAVKDLAGRISEDYLGKSVFIVGILKGAFIFMADLVRQVTVPVQIDFIAVSSYGKSTVSSGAVQIIKDLETDITGCHVILVEDIVDTGLTLGYLKDNLAARKPASIKVCALFDKPSRRKMDVKVEYCGMAIPDKFAVGYGLDYAEKYRNLNYVAALKPEIYRK